MNDVEIRQALKERIAMLKPGASIVVGIMDNSGSRVIAEGVTNRKQGRAADGDTVYEIGSITKTFTALLLEDMASKGEIQPDDPVRAYLPPTIKLPAGQGREMTLLDLALHRSGLPREAGNQKKNRYGEFIGPYAQTDLYRFLSGYQLEIAIGTPLYSNVGYQLLGHALVLRARQDYESLIENRIAGPLNMRSTRIEPTPDMRRRFATGYREDGSEAPAIGQKQLPGDGSLLSSAHDLLRFLGASMQTKPAPVHSAVAGTRGIADASTRPGWDHVRTPNMDLWFKNGRTYGYSSFIGYDARSGNGIVLLSNSAVHADDIALRALDNKFRLRQIQVPPAFERAMEESDYRAVLAGYRAFKHRDPKFFLDEGPLNEWGYALLKAGKERQALELFRLGVYLRPKNYNTHDSLAEGYEKAGQPDLAVSSYQTSLKLNPGNIHAIVRLKALGAME